MAESPTPRFKMVGTRSAILEGPIAEPIEQQIDAIENALESVPDFAFDLSKTLVESVCKTVLADIGHPAENKLERSPVVEGDYKSPEFICLATIPKRRRRETRWR